MPRPHFHACEVCGAKVECGGEFVQNWDGEPAVICDEFHRPDGSVAEVICDACEALTDEGREAVRDARAVRV